MTTTIDLPKEVYERLEKHAHTRGATVTEAIAQFLAEAEADRVSVVVEQMRAEGVILPKQALPLDYQRVYQRIEVQGRPVSECLIEERR